MLCSSLVTYDKSNHPWVKYSMCHAPLHEECRKHHGHKEDPGVTPGTYGAVGERAQVILVWARALGVENASHPWRLGGTRVTPWAMRSSWRGDSRMLKIILIRGVSWALWQFEWGAVPGQRPGTAVPGSDSRDCKGSNRHNFLNTCPNGASEESIGIYVKRRWRWSGCLLESDIIQGSYDGLKLLRASRSSG